jgi:hypothetical protein
MAKAKGSILVPMVKYLRKQRERALALLPPELHSYLNEKIIVSAWYPEEDLLGLIRTRLQIEAASPEQVLETMGRLTAQGHHEGVYAHLLEDGGSSHAAGALWSSQHDTGALVRTREGSGQIRIDLEGYAHPSREMCTIIQAYLGETLRFAGLADVVATELSCVTRGAERCSWRFRWRSDREADPAGSAPGHGPQ